LISTVYSESVRLPTALLMALNVILLSCCAFFALQRNCKPIFCLPSGSSMYVTYTEILFSGRIEVTERRGRSKQLLDDLKKKEEDTGNSKR
jgi:hypothetical protein